MIKVLFVCLGNICRSPVAEAIFKHRVGEAGLEGKLFADSAGTSAYHLGEPPDHRSVMNAQQNGVTVAHRARQFTAVDFDEFDFILAMDQDNLDEIKVLEQAAGTSHSGVMLFGSFFDRDLSLEVPDPYFGGSQGFQKVFDILDAGNIKLIEYLKRKL